MSLTAYLATQETNAKVEGDVSELVSDAATLGEIKQRVNELPSLMEKLDDVSSFAEAKSLIRSYQTEEATLNKDTPAHK